jgi:hypothetical protein
MESRRLVLHTTSCSFYRDMLENIHLILLFLKKAFKRRDYHFGKLLRHLQTTHKVFNCIRETWDVVRIKLHNNLMALLDLPKPTCSYGTKGTELGFVSPENTAIDPIQWHNSFKTLLYLLISPCVGVPCSAQPPKPRIQCNESSLILSLPFLETSLRPDPASRRLCGPMFLCVVHWNKFFRKFAEFSDSACSVHFSLRANEFNNIECACISNNFIICYGQPLL